MIVPLTPHLALRSIELDWPLKGSRTGSGFGVWGQAVTTARFSVSYSFAPFTRNRAPLPRVLTAALRLR